MKQAGFYVGLAAAVFGVIAAAPVYAAEGTFDSNGVEIRYIDEGEGEPVILVHGFSASIEFNWRSPGVIDALSDEYRVIALDNRGHGKSEKPHGAEHYGAEMAMDVIRLMDHLEIERAHVVGYSMGGFITLYLAANHPDRLITAVPSGAGWSPPDSPEANFSERIAESLENGDGFAPLFELLTPEGQPKPTEEEMKATNAMMTAVNDVKALASVMRGMSEFSLTQDQVSSFDVPMLAIIGEIDPLKAGVDALSSANPDVEVAVVSGADHMNAPENPEFIAALEAFLVEHSTSKAVATN